MNALRFLLRRYEMILQKARLSVPAVRKGYAFPSKSS